MYPIYIGAAPTEHLNVRVLEKTIQSLNITIKDEEFITQQKDGEKSFSRDRVFTFGVLLSFLMTNLQKGLQREIAAFAEAIQSDGAVSRRSVKPPFVRHETN